MTPFFLEELHRFHGMHAVLVSLGLLALVWLWNVWDCLRHPGAVAALRRFRGASSAIQDPHDLQALRERYGHELETLARPRSDSDGLG